MLPSSDPLFIQTVAAALFGLALLHTFSAKQFERLSHRFPRHAGLFHLLGDVFGLWAIVLVLAIAWLGGSAAALRYAESRHYTEPLFVFVIMVIAASRPIVHVVLESTQAIARLAPVPTAVAAAWLGLAGIPLLGSFITEPAAITIAALMLAPQIFRPGIPERLKHFALGVLFVNVSIGGTLTSFAAPPVLMVAAKWNWDTGFMAATFGWKAGIAVIVNATLAALLLRRHLSEPMASEASEAEVRTSIPISVVAIHFVFLVAVVLLAHHPVAFLAVFLLFLGYAQAYERHQSPLIVREALLVAFFLAGLVVLGGLQEWWLQPLVSSMGPTELFFGAAALTAVTDNAALTYLGSLIEGISAEARYSLVAGAVAGGGLTVIANAPNPAGVALLRRGFDDESIGAGGLLAGALVPTAIAVAALKFL
jgi:hypothetical protein